MKYTEIEQLLPEVFQRTLRPGLPLFALLEVMELLHVPSELALTHLDARFDPRRTPEEFVPFLARWIDLERLFAEEASQEKSPGRMRLSTGLGRLRELIASGADLSKWRGTGRGLRRFLQIATGTNGYEILENVSSTGEPVPYHLLVMAPGTMESHRHLITQIIESEKPAYVTYEVCFEATTGG
jgi:phage tail-like protein